VLIAVTGTRTAEGMARLPGGSASVQWEEHLEPRNDLDRFLAGVERRALRMAEIATGSRDEAMDIVQDSMFQLARRYRQRAADEWGPLFHRILQNRIRDWYRHGKTRRRWLEWMRPDDDDDDPVENIPDPRAAGPENLLGQAQAGTALEVALRQLPRRQQQAFLLRVWEGLDVSETAAAMNCSEGSVKTHFSRAVHTLRGQLESHWP